MVCAVYVHVCGYVYVYVLCNDINLKANESFHNFIWFDADL